MKIIKTGHQSVTILRISARNPKIKLKIQVVLDQISNISHSLNCIAVETIL